VTTAGHAVAEEPAGSAGKSPLLLVAIIVLLLLALAGTGYALWGRTEHSQNGVAGVQGLKPGTPTILSMSQLESFAAAEGPVYWAGPRKGTNYEVTVTTAGAVYVRYLPEGVRAGSKNDYLTIGTYNAIDGYDALAAASSKDATVELSRTGAVIATFHSAPDSTYFAFPKADFQVEVFSPVAGQALELTESSAIGLVPGRS